MFIIYGEIEERDILPRELRDCKASKSLNNNVGATRRSQHWEPAFLSSHHCRLQSPGGSRPAHTIRWCSTSTSTFTSTMFNHKNTPSSFLRKNNVERRSSLPKRCDGWRNVSKDVGGEIKSSRPASSCSGEDGERDGGYQYQCVSVSTRWSWDDIFTTVNTTQAEGN